MVQYDKYIWSTQTKLVPTLDNLKLVKFGLVGLVLALVLTLWTHITESSQRQFFFDNRYWMSERILPLCIYVKNQNG